MSELTVITKVSGQVPPAGSVVVEGPRIWNVSKSSLNQQMSEAKSMLILSELIHLFSSLHISYYCKNGKMIEKRWCPKVSIISHLFSSNVFIIVLNMITALFKPRSVFYRDLRLKMLSRQTIIHFMWSWSIKETRVIVYPTSICLLYMKSTRCLCKGLENPDFWCKYNSGWLLSLMKWRGRDNKLRTWKTFNP